MLPDNVLSETPLPGGGFIASKREAWGGIALNDASAGLNYQLWELDYVNGVVSISAPNNSGTVLFARNGLTELSFAFDQNMRPAVAFAHGGHVYLWWYDTLVGQYVFTNFGRLQNPYLTLDDNRPTQTDDSDIILSYRDDKKLYVRYQRNRYSIPYLLADGVLEVRQAGMLSILRYGFDATQIRAVDDESLVDSRNPAGALKNHLDLCPLQTSYGGQFGDATIANKVEKGKSRLDKFNINQPDMINVSYMLNDADYVYFQAFYRVWCKAPKPFISKLMIDQRGMAQYNCQFVPGSVQMQRNSALFAVSAQFEVQRHYHSSASDNALVQSRN